MIIEEGVYGLLAFSNLACNLTINGAHADGTKKYRASIPLLILGFNQHSLPNVVMECNRLLMQLACAIFYRVMACDCDTGPWFENNPRMLYSYTSK